VFPVLRIAGVLATAGAALYLSGGYMQPVHSSAVKKPPSVSEAQRQDSEQLQLSWQAAMRQTQTQIVAQQQQRIAAQRSEEAAEAQAAARAAAEARAQAAAQAQARAQAAAQSQAGSAKPSTPATTPTPVATATPAPKPTPPPVSVGEARQIILNAFAPQGQAAVTWGLAVATCESSDNSSAYNSSGASGLFQFLPSTFAETPQGQAGDSIWDPVANASAAAWMYGRGRQAAWGECNESAKPAPTPAAAPTPKPTPPPPASPPRSS